MPTEFSDYIETRDPVVTANGTELMVVSKDGESVQMTTQQVADLADPGSTVGVLRFIGTWNTTNAFPSSGGTGTGGAPGIGNIWLLTDFLSDGVNFYPAGTLIMSIVDVPASSSDWVKFGMQL